MSEDVTCCTVEMPVKLTIIISVIEYVHVICRPNLMWDTLYFGVVLAVGAFNASGRVGNARESIRGFHRVPTRRIFH